MKSSHLALSIRLKWLAFRWLERLAASDGPEIAPLSQALIGSNRPAVWIFVSTIGELNAIGPFLRLLIQQTPHLQLVLITDRSIYRAAYLAQYPQAEVIEIDADNARAFVLASLRPPKLFIVAEIPALPSDAPCRLPLGYLIAAKQRGASIALVNGWLYGYAPSCRMDHIERQWFGRGYLRLFDVLAVQNTAVAEALIAAGAEPSCVHVTGNIKFDALDSTPRPLDQSASPQLLASLTHSTRPIIVAGCVTDDDERDLVLDALVGLRINSPDAMLVLAPRHPENPAVMRDLALALQARQLPYELRSTRPDSAWPEHQAVLVLDTMGELRDFYAIASVTHVGRDHNVLEPLAYGKMVTVRTGWDQTYPSYPVFQTVLQGNAVQSINAHSVLTQAWLENLQALDHPATLPLQKKFLLDMSGASLRNLALIKTLLQ